MPSPLEERPSLETMLLLGAEGRNAGKTTLACDLIARFSGAFPVVGVKVTTVEDGAGPCPRGGARCGACSGLDGRWCIEGETGTATGKDTARMLQSGAARVFWARSRPDSLRECLAGLLALIEPRTLVVAESNSLAHVCDPGLFLMLRGGGAGAFKASARAVLHHVDRIVISDGASFDLDPADIAVSHGTWQLLDASAVILAGGASSRMGRDKSLLDIHGVPLVKRLIAQLEGRFRQVFIGADDPAPYRDTGVTVIRDDQAGQGPLAGIAAALRAAGTETVFVVACDIPDIDQRFLRRLRAEGRQADCAVPRRADGRWEPLFSVWNKRALPAVREALAEGKRKVDTVFPRIRTAAVDLVDGEWLCNLNTPRDVAEYLGRTPPLQPFTEPASSPLMK